MEVVTRKELDILIDDEGRDKGKTFHITEMSAYDAEAWAIRAILALTNANVELGQDFDPGMGMANFTGAAFRALLAMHYEDAKPLLDEMMRCVTIKPDPMHPNITRPLLENDTEEVKTLFRLRTAVLTLHTGFSLPGS
jgi:hypothetical protein